MNFKKALLALVALNVAFLENAQSSDTIEEKKNHFGRRKTEESSPQNISLLEQPKKFLEDTMPRVIIRSIPDEFGQLFRAFARTGIQELKKSIFGSEGELRTWTQIGINLTLNTSYKLSLPLVFQVCKLNTTLSYLNYPTAIGTLFGFYILKDCIQEKAAKTIQLSLDDIKLAGENWDQKQTTDEPDIFLNEDAMEYGLTVFSDALKTFCFIGFDAVKDLGQSTLSFSTWLKDRYVGTDTVDAKKDDEYLKKINFNLVKFGLDTVTQLDFTDGLNLSRPLRRLKWKFIRTMREEAEKWSSTRNFRGSNRSNQTWTGWTTDLAIDIAYGSYFSTLFFEASKFPGSYAFGTGSVFSLYLAKERLKEKTSECINQTFENIKIAGETFEKEGTVYEPNIFSNPEALEYGLTVMGHFLATPLKIGYSVATDIGGGIYTKAGKFMTWMYGE